MKNEISVAGEKEAVLAVVAQIKSQHEDMVSEELYCVLKIFYK
jgi:hypothetical protein